MYNPRVHDFNKNSAVELLQQFHKGQKKSSRKSLLVKVTNQIDEININDIYFGLSDKET